MRLGPFYGIRNGGRGGPDVRFGSGACDGVARHVPTSSVYQILPFDS